MDTDSRLSRIEQRVEEIMKELKDFQRASVRYLFEQLIRSRDDHQHDRMLVADEVGLGKTLIAKGIVALMYQHFLQKQHNRFNVVYICSNQGIASQNLSKLMILEDESDDQVGATRLTMLAIRDRKPGAYLNMISLTPGTSFHLIDGTGIKDERVILYCMLSQREDMKLMLDSLKFRLQQGVGDTKWDDAIKWGEQNYAPKLDPIIVRRFNENLDSDSSFLALLKEQLKCQRQDPDKEPILAKQQQSQIQRSIGKLRQMLAQACVEGLQPDLVIMDEFQRFKELMPDMDHEADEFDLLELTRRLFATDKLMILLLSATPYKLYATTEEAAEGENHLAEFQQLLRFLCNDEVEFSALKEQWGQYSRQLLNLATSEIEPLVHCRQELENLMQVLMVRTERLLVSDSGDAMIDTRKSVKPVSVDPGEIETFLAMDGIIKGLQERKLSVPFPLDYCKSAAYPLSFMEHYAMKDSIRKAYEQDPSLKTELKRSQKVWVSMDAVKDYQAIDYPNSRLQTLIKETISENTVKLLWLPPSMPCYPVAGPFADVGFMSKVLVFSCWEMVPRMISVLLSYEAERQTLGNSNFHFGCADENLKKRYFAQKKSSVRLPRPRLNFRSLYETIKENEYDENDFMLAPDTAVREQGRLSLFALLYPSRFLAESFNAIESLNSRWTIVQTRDILAQKYRVAVQQIEALNLWCCRDPERQRVDPRWYWAAPLLLDLCQYGSETRQWLNLTPYWFADKSEDGAQVEHWGYLRRIASGSEKLGLGLMPPDLPEHLALMSIGSPAVILLRSLRAIAPNADIAELMYAAAVLADGFRDKFNLPESIAAVDLSMGAEGIYWRRVLEYCAQGCLQSVMDEFMHMIRDSHGLRNASDNRKISKIRQKVNAALSLRTAQLNVESLGNFLGNDKREYRMRVHFATCYRNLASDDRSQQRADQVRDAFNSPFRPFVLATTSIGQEGLDFHYYCRKIMHWNLPHNPIDLEQREGRINRYKGLAIRSILAKRYAGQIRFSRHGAEWDELFEMARRQLPGAGAAHEPESRTPRGEDRPDCTAQTDRIGRASVNCDMVPFWHVEPTDLEPRIERIVPYCPMSREQDQMDWLLNVLSVYRVSLGQARQEELVRFILNNVPEDRRRQIDRLLLNLSPIAHAIS